MKVVQKFFCCFLGLFLVFFTCRFSLCKSCCGKLLFLAVGCIDVHSFCFFFVVNGRECILLIWYLKAAILCSMGLFEKKLLVLSVMAGLRNMLISSLGAYKQVKEDNNPFFLYA